MSTAALRLHVAAFGELSARTLHDLLKLRVDVFVVEQECAYPELDGRDVEPGTRHLWLERDGAIVAYLRILADPGGVARIGRVLVAPAARRQGLAGRLLTEALALVGERPCVLDAQSHLAGFYRAHGFTDTGPEFVEDGIPHLPMRRDPGEPSPQPSFADPAATNVVAPRAATAGDAPELVRLRVLMLTAMAGGTAPPPGPWLTATEETLRRRLAEAEPTMAAYVVDNPDRPGELAACAVGTIEERLGTPGNPGGLSGHLFNVCTDPGQRRRGYARACMQELLRWYRGRGVGAVDLAATEEGAPLYRELGFAPLTAMRLTTPGAEPKTAPPPLREAAGAEVRGRITAGR